MAEMNKVCVFFSILYLKLKIEDKTKRGIVLAA